MRRADRSWRAVALLAIASMLMASLSSRAANFDCRKVKTGVGNAICADPQSSEYDEAADDIGGALGNGCELTVRLAASLSRMAGANCP